MITSTPAARRGRPRAFDREAALEKAMQAFWARGYDGTSMAQLVEAMGINSPSIYAAFGSKEGLFFEAVELYISSEVGPVWRVLEEAGDTASAIQAMLFALIDVFFATEPSRGCLIGLGAGYL
ncbi:TetR/AcrR family transcriptional regulator, partial [Litorivivens sp.]|uniref:TetR/AcrR family transcriptional regulator n=1 Tax=Litorivivens sp. TaxID=2020868 RepID=UPI003566C7AD